MSARAGCWPYHLPKHTLTFLSPLTARSLAANVKAVVQLWATNVCGWDWLCFTIDGNYSNTPGNFWVWGPMCQLFSWNVIYCCVVACNGLRRHTTFPLRWFLVLFFSFLNVGTEYPAMRSHQEPRLQINSVCCPLVVTTLSASQGFYRLLTDSGFVFTPCFSELLQSLDMCDNDPVAIAQCFVDKVSGTFSCWLKIASRRINEPPFFLLFFFPPRVNTFKYTLSIAPTIPSMCFVRSDLFYWFWSHWSHVFAVLQLCGSPHRLHEE